MYPIRLLIDQSSIEFLIRFFSESFQDQQEKIEQVDEPFFRNFLSNFYEILKF